MNLDCPTQFIYATFRVLAVSTKLFLFIFEGLVLCVCVTPDPTSCEGRIRGRGSVGPSEVAKLWLEGGGVTALLGLTLYFL